MRRSDRTRNERIKDLCIVGKGVNIIVSENVQKLCEQVRRMNTKWLLKRIYERECSNRRGIGRLRKR